MDWKEYSALNKNNITKLAKGNPELMRGLRELGKAEEAKGALSLKTRELISLAVAATTRCDGCIAVHAEAAAKAGASRNELLETLAVAVSLNAGAALVYSGRILDAFDQFAGEEGGGV